MFVAAYFNTFNNTLTAYEVNTRSESLKHVARVTEGVYGKAAAHRHHE